MDFCPAYFPNEIASSMSSPVEFYFNHATQAEIVSHLSCCDIDFVPPLSARVEINSYAHKIIVSATRFEAWADGVLVGLVAAYCNDSERRTAYITSVSVLRGRKDEGIASYLLERCIMHVKILGFECLELEADSENYVAIRLYAKKNFVINRVIGRLSSMRLNIKITNK